MNKKKIGSFLIAMTLVLGGVGVTSYKMATTAFASVSVIGTSYNSVSLGSFPGGVYTVEMVGTYNSYVYKIQQALNEMAKKDGYGNMETIPDGYYGSTTRDAVRNFQLIWNAHQSSKLTVDGQVGSATWNAIKQCHQ